nr:ABC-F family ATP-binding cassette domain-containing protein [uncultured Bacillus sp.]
MKILSIEHVSKSYGEKILFRDLSFTIAEKERVGLIGVNGTGKSSLLKIIADIDHPDEGEIIFPKDYRISYSAQKPDLHSNLTVLEQIFAGDAPVFQLLREYEKTLSMLHREPENRDLQERLFTQQKEMDVLNAWDVNTNAKTVLTKLEIEDFEQKIGDLSGGQKKRVALAQVLIQSPDLLILDEPTNHLDYESVKWLEDYLNRYSGSLLLVTHDRYFLDRVTNRIFELEGGQLYSYKGNYTAFLESKAIREEQEAASIEKQKNLFRRELEWIRRGAQARSTKQKARIQRFEQIEDKLTSVKTKENLDMSLKGSRLGKQVFELKDASKKFADQVMLQHFHFLVKPGDRIGIIGKNGTGKSTLLNILAGRIALDSGERIIGQTVKIAFYTQESEDLDENKRMIEYLKEAAEVIETSDGKTLSAAQMLERFLFPPYSHGTPIRKLSGGEKRRLYLLKILMREPNVLLLDEPTNDLDTQTLTVLEDYLEDFSGVVITVSHDRYFLDKVVQQLLILNGNGQMDTFYGNYTEYLENQMRAEEPNKEETKKQPAIQEKSKKKRMSYKEQKEFETIEDDIAAIESRLEEIAGELNQVGSDFEKAQKLSEEEQDLNEKLEYMIERWTYLTELSEQSK